MVAPAEARPAAPAEARPAAPAEADVPTESARSSVTDLDAARAREQDGPAAMRASEAMKILETLDIIDAGHVDIEDRGEASPVADDAVACEPEDVIDEERRIVDAADDFSRTTTTIQSITRELEDLVSQIKGRGSVPATAQATAGEEAVGVPPPPPQASDGDRRGSPDRADGAPGAAGEEDGPRRLLHAEVSHTPSPVGTKTASRSADEDGRAAGGGAPGGREASRGDAPPEFRMSGFRRQLLEREAERIQRIMGSKAVPDNFGAAPTGAPPALTASR